MKTSIARLLSIVSIPLLVASLFFGIYVYKKSEKAVTLPDYGAAIAFKLTDANDQPFDSSSLLGKPWILTFIFTHCPDQCPLMVSKLAKLSRQLPALSFVSITSDPKNDTPQVMTAYMKKQNGPSNWSFLTGDEKAIRKIAGDFMISAPDSPGLHSTRFVLVDSRGRIRGFYDSQSRDQLNTLAIDIRGLED